MSKWRLKKKIALKPEVKEKIDRKKEEAFSVENLAKVGSMVTIGSGVMGIVLKGVKLKKELK